MPSPFIRKQEQRKAHEAVDWAKRTRGHLNLSQKGILLILADYYNPAFDYAWPPTKLLAEDAEIHVRSVLRHLQNLEYQGFITINRKSHEAHSRNNTYTLHFDRVYALDLTGDRLSPVSDTGDAINQPDQNLTGDIPDNRQVTSIAPTGDIPVHITSNNKLMITPTLSVSSPDVEETGASSIEVEENVDVEPVANGHLPGFTDAEPTEIPPSQESNEPSADTSKVQHKAVMEWYRETIGYPIPNGGKEAAAVNWMLRNSYSPDDIKGCYEHLKAQRFYADKPLSLMTVKTNIGEWRVWRDRGGTPAPKVQRPQAQRQQGHRTQPLGDYTEYPEQF